MCNNAEDIDTRCTSPVSLVCRPSYYNTGKPYLKYRQTKSARLPNIGSSDISKNMGTDTQPDTGNLLYTVYLFCLKTSVFILLYFGGL